MNLTAARALLYFILYADLVPYMEMAGTMGDWGMLGSILLSMCNPIVIATS